jgi:hypothetical protein
MSRYDAVEPSEPSEMVASPVLEARTHMLYLLGGFMVTQLLGVAARLGIADRVPVRGRAVSDVAAEIGVDADALRRVLRALASLGVFHVDDGVVTNTVLSGLFRSAAPMSMRWLAQSFSGEHYRVWEAAGLSIQDGRQAFDRVFGKPYFDWLGEHGEEAAAFNLAMAGNAVARQTLLEDYDWSDVETVVDVGGGTGAMLTSVLRRHPRLRGIVYDLPHARAEAEATIARAGLGGRCRFEPGDFFERVPAGADLYVLSQILHDWDDEHATMILRHCREAAGPHARLLVLDWALPTTDEQHWGKLLDLHMLVLLGGRERTVPEWDALLRAGGFTLDGVVAESPAGSLLQAART